ncbi:MAG: creatininase family protein [bacterium]|nr:creatininase family protein [bacterium]
MTDYSLDPTAYEFVRPARMGQVLEETPIVFLPVGCMEYHGPHLPLGVDMLTADAICHRTAEVTGGVVLPPLWLASGVLPLPHSITVDTGVLRAAVRPILRQLAEGGFKAIIVFSGHGALDHLHVLREETDRVMGEFPDVNALTTVWNELNAIMSGDIHDHGAKVETSYLLEFHPRTVDLTTLEDDPEAHHVGVYAANPRFTASREWGVAMADHAVGRLAGIIEGFFAGERADSWVMLRELVTRLQSGDLEVVTDSGDLDGGPLRFELYNPHPQSKYITAVGSLSIDGREVDLAGATLANLSVGEGHTDTRVDRLGPLSGFYVRTDQRMVVTVSGTGIEPGLHEVEAEFVLADVLQVGARGNLRIG